MYLRLEHKMSTYIFLLIVWDTIDLALCFPKMFDEEM